MKHVFLWVMIISLLGVVGGCDVDTISNEQGAGSSEKGGAQVVDGTPGVKQPEITPPEVVPPEVVPPETVPPEIRQPEKRLHEKKPLVKRTHKKRTHETKPTETGSGTGSNEDGEPEEGETQEETGTPAVEPPEEENTPTKGESGEGETQEIEGEEETPENEAPEEGTPEERPEFEAGESLLLINELRTEYILQTKNVEYIELKAIQAANLGGVSLYIMHEAEQPFIYQFPAVDVAADSYITLHLRTLDSFNVDELGDDISAWKGNDTSSTARDLWAAGNNKLLYQTDIVYLQDAKGAIMDAVVLNETPAAAWNTNQAHFAEITEKLYKCGMWQSSSGFKPTPLDAVDTSAIGCSVMKSVCRYEGRENTHSAKDWYVTAEGLASPGRPNK